VESAIKRLKLYDVEPTPLEGANNPGGYAS
jgi:hypothetical protein